ERVRVGGDAAGGIAPNPSGGDRVRPGHERLPGRAAGRRPPDGPAAAVPTDADRGGAGPGGVTLPDVSMARCRKSRRLARDTAMPARAGTMGRMSASPDDADPRPWERPGAVRRDCEPDRGQTLLLLGCSALVLGVVGLCILPLAL